MSYEQKVWSENENYTVEYDQSSIVCFTNIQDYNNEMLGMNWFNLYNHKEWTQLIQCGILIFN